MNRTISWFIIVFALLMVVYSYAHAADISSNASDITANSSAISANTSAISDHADSITAHHNRLAAAYGFVNEHYLDDMHGSDNVSSVTWNDAESRYEIEFDERICTYYFSCSVAVTTYGPYSRFASASPSGSAEPILYVFIYDEDGNRVESSFHWVVFAH